jgi:acyl carrier protein
VDFIDGAGISLGRPLPGEEICIVGRDGALMPQGFPGEICISGEGVGRGYLNQAELTQKHFVSLPFLPGKRAYRTGDLGKIAPDRKLHFLGRNDSQVKIQGVRVETPEIENQLLRHEAVKDAVVLARDKEAGGKTLWAYVIAEAQEHDLRQFLARHLPYYLIPEVFVFMTRFPKTASGKTDRQGLLHKPGPEREMNSDGDRPSAIELELMRIWEEILRPDKPLHLHDSFFTLGGNSLKAAQVITQTHEELGVRLALRDVFAAPTIAQLARLVEAAQWANAKSNGLGPAESEEFIV